MTTKPEWVPPRHPGRSRSVQLRQAVIGTLADLIWAAVVGLGYLLLDYLKAHGVEANDPGRRGRLGQGTRPAPLSTVLFVTLWMTAAFAWAAQYAAGIARKLTAWAARP